MQFSYTYSLLLLLDGIKSGLITYSNKGEKNGKIRGKSEKFLDKFLLE